MFINELYTVFKKRKEEHVFNLSALDATERYLTFSNSNRYINSEVQVKHLSTFLGMNPDTLSKLRKP